MTRTTPNVPRFALTIAEAAESIGLGRSSFYELVLPHVRTVSVGRRVLIPVDELTRYLETNADRATLDPDRRNV